MENSIEEILQNLSDNKYDADTAFNKIQHFEPAPITNDIVNKKVKNAKKIKIMIDGYDDEKDKMIHIHLPAISFKFASTIVGWIVKLTTKYAKDDNGNKIQLKDDTIIQIKDVIGILGSYPPFELVSVDSEDGKVHIYTC